MFIIFGSGTDNKKLNYVQQTRCPNCGNVCTMGAYMHYSYFSLFFIPMFKYSKSYFLKMSCCGACYELKDELGRRLEKGEYIQNPV